MRAGFSGGVVVDFPHGYVEHSRAVLSFMLANVIRSNIMGSMFPSLENL